MQPIYTGVNMHLQCLEAQPLTYVVLNNNNSLRCNDMPTLNKNTIRRPWQAERIAQAGRANPNTAIYNGTVWRKLSVRYKMANPVCVECIRVGVVSPAEVTDHIVPINQGGDVYAWDNLQSLCHRCHNSKSGKEGHYRPNTDTDKGEGG